MERRVLAALIPVLIAAHAVVPGGDTSLCHSSCAACYENQGGFDKCTECNVGREFRPLAGQSYGICQECDSADLALDKATMRVPIPFRLRLQGPDTTAGDSKCLSAGNSAGNQELAVVAAECYSDLVAQPDLWRMDQAGVIQWRPDSGQELGSCLVRRSCLASKGNQVVILKSCQEGLDAGWNLEWKIENGYLKSKEAEELCLHVTESASELRDCVEVDHEATGFAGVRYTDGLLGRDGGEVKWSRCITPCDEQDQFPPHGRCVVTGPEKGWGTCQESFAKKPTIAELEQNYASDVAKAEETLKQHHSRAQLLYSRCLARQANRTVNGARSLQYCQDAAVNSGDRTPEAGCLAAGCQWEKQLHYCYFNRTEIPCELFPNSETCAAAGHCSESHDAADRFECTDTVDRLTTLATEELSEQTRDATVTQRFDAVAEEQTVASKTERMLAAELDAQDSADLSLDGDEQLAAELAASLDAATSSQSLIGRSNFRRLLSVDDGSSSQFFGLLPDIVNPDPGGCSSSCSSGDLVCGGQDETCVPDHRECVKLCKSTEVRTAREARQDGDRPSLVRLKADCELQKLVQCQASLDSPGSREKCDWITRVQCKKLWVLWENQQANTVTAGQEPRVVWETDGNGEEEYVMVAPVDGNPCPPIGKTGDHCSAFESMG